MRRWTVQLVGATIGCGSFFLAGPFKFLGFFLSILALSISIRADNQRLNIHILLVSMFMFVLFCSNVITFDASNPIDYDGMMDYVQTGAETLTIIIAFGIPLMLIVGGMWAVIVGQVESGVRSIFWAVLIMAVSLCMCFIFKAVGIFSFGIAEWILEFYTEMISWMFELPIAMYEMIDGGMMGMGMGMDLPDIPDNNHFRQPEEQSGGGGGDIFGGGGSGSGDGLFGGLTNGGLTNLGGGDNDFDVTQVFNTEVGFDVQTDMTYSEYVSGTQDAMPLIAGLINAVSIPYFKNRKTEAILVAFINRFMNKPKKEPKKRRFSRTDPTMIVFAFFLMIGAFFIFLSYTHSYGQNAREDWKYIVFIYYIVVSGFSIFFLMRFNNYTRATLSNTLKGTIYGVFGLFMLTRLFFTGNVVRAYSAVDMHNNEWYAINTFIFIAPAETLIFLLALPCLGLWLITKGYRKEEIYEAELSIRYQTIRVDDRVAIQEQLINEKKDTIAFWEYMDGKVYEGEEGEFEKMGTETIVARKSDEKHVLENELKDFKRVQKRLDGAEPSIDVQIDEVISEPLKAVLFIVVIFLSCFIFASLHWVVVSPDISYDMFWLVGLGVIYFAGGLWFIIIGWKYGWLSAVLCHALYNTSSILLVVLSAGV